MGKNVAVFVDVANIFYAAKAAGVDIDYVTLLKASSAGRDLVRAYAYTGLDPENENQRNFHDFLRRHGYRVVSKDIRKYGDGKVKANLDIELVVDMMKTARNLDVAIVVSGDGDFAPAIRAVQEQGVRVEVVSFRGNTSSDLMDVADLFTDITQIAKVEKGSSRSGRRVATDDEDLSMTEVPDKQSEGTGERTRGRGRTRRVAATTTAAGRARRRAPAAGDGGEPALVVLPGEKLSRVAASAEPAETDEASVDDASVDDGADDGAAIPDEGAAAERGLDQGQEDGRRRRRRRGGRGRGRGRGREEEGFVEAGTAAPRALDDEDAAEDEEAPPPSRRAASTFGSVWDSQIGIPSSRGAPLVEDDEDLEEPAVPEYLLAERRRRDSGRGRGGRGRGGAYAAALDRERFGGGRGSTPSRFSEPAPRREGAFGRPDRGERADRDRGDRERGDRGDRQPFRGTPRPAPRGSGDEPWSEVPPEIEAMLRAQLGSRAATEPRRAETTAPADPTPIEAEPAAMTGDAPATTTPRRSRSTGGVTRGGRMASAVTEAAPAGADEAEATATPRRTSRSRAAAGSGPTTRTPRTSTRRTGARAATAAADDSGAEAAGAADGEATAAVVAPKRRTTRKKAEPAA